MLSWLRANAVNLTFAGAILGLGVGFYLAWPPLGFIIPCALVLGLMVWARAVGENGGGDA